MVVRFEIRRSLACLSAGLPGKMGPHRIVRQSRRKRESGSIFRFDGPGDSAASADFAGYSPGRKASHSGARGSAPTACTCETRPEEHQGDYADYLYEGRTAGLLGKARVFTL